jgi:hypothetical protein
MVAITGLAWCTARQCTDGRNLEEVAELSNLDDASTTYCLHMQKVNFTIPLQINMPLGCHVVITNM